MSQSNAAACVEIARDYYDSSDADNFYFNIWGGEDLHIGIYEQPDEPIFDASRRTVRKMAERVNGLGPDTRVLDLGAGFGGSARYLANTYGCHVTALNLSEVQNRRNRKMTREQGLAHLVKVVEASFEDIPLPDKSYDVVWSQDAILHSADRARVLDEVRRVLKPGGQCVFTDPMAADDCPTEVLRPILDRIHLENLGSPGFYQRAMRDRGFQNWGYDDFTKHLVNHYGRVLKETERCEGELCESVSREYIRNMKTGLGHWVDGGRKGYLAWGIFSYQSA